MSYNKNNNYGGSNAFHKGFTRYIYRVLPRVNYIWFKHDENYIDSFKQPLLIMVIISKLLNDFSMLLNGFIYNILQWNILKGVWGVIVIIFSYVLVTLYTYKYIKTHWKGAYK